MSPRPRSSRSASVNITDIGGTASRSSESSVSIDVTVVVTPAGSTVTGSPAASVPETILPAYSRSPPSWGRPTHWIGNRSRVRSRSACASTRSRYSSSDGPW